MYVFSEPAGGWASETQTAKLTQATPTANNAVGEAVAIGGNTIFASAPLANGYSGQIYFFNKPASGGWVNAGSNGTLTTTSSGLVLLGNSLAATSNTLVAGAALEGNATGNVDVYVEPSGGWASASQTALLTGSDSASGDTFGSSVAISGSTIAIGAPGATIGSNAGQGATYVFTQPSGGWATATQTAKLTASNGAAGDSLGNSVAVSGSTVYAAADVANGGIGAVYTYNQPSGAWANATQTSEVTPSDGVSGDAFGSAIAAGGATLVADSDAATVNGNSGQGAAYVFQATAPPAVTTQPANATVASGGTATFTAAASGNPIPGIQWQVSTNGGSTWANDTADSGATSGTLTVAGVTAGESGYEYRAVFTSTQGTATSNAATLSVTSPPAITTQPAGTVTVNAGANATFTAAASGTPAPTVQWQVSTNSGSTWTNVSGATSTTLTVSAVTASQNGSEYRAVFSNSGGTATTTASTLVVQTPPAVTTPPANVTVTAGNNASFTAVASGNPAPTVQWQVSTNSGSTWTNDTTDAGNTSGTLTVAATTASQNGYEYRAVFTNVVSSVNSAAATLTVQYAPSVTTQPSNATVNAGANATFTSAASGNPAATVQWQVSTNSGSTWTNVSGGTSATLTVSATTASQNGYEYRAVFTNSVGSATSSAATLTVDYAPTVTTQPAATTVTAGSPASFTAAASGNPAATVQWQVSTNSGSTWTNDTTDSGNTTGTLTISATTATQNGYEYRAVFTNSVGSATSSAATLTVQTPPSVTTQPSNATVNAGANATFTSAASGNPAATVQWQVSTNGGSTWTNVSGGTSATLTVSATTASQNGYEYRAVFTNSVGSATSNPATLTVDYAPTISAQPAAATVTAGQAASFTAAASGNPSPTVQWQVSTNSGSTWTNDTTDSGNTSGTLTVASTTASQNGYEYRAVFTNSVGSATSTGVALTVDYAPSVTTQPVSATVNAGSNATFTAAASGNPAATVQWQVSTDGGVTWTNVTTGGTSPTLTVSAPPAADNGYEYRAVFTNSVGSATTNAATLTVDYAPTISAQPAATTVTAGQSASFSVTAAGNPAPTYQWQVSTNNGSTWTNVSGGTSATLAVASTTAGQNASQYRVVVTNSVSSVTSSAAVLSVQFAPSVTTQPASTTATQGGNATFSSAASGNPAPTVQWQVSTNSGSTWTNDTSDSGNTTGTLTVAATTTNSGYEYRAVFTNSIGSATSNAATLTTVPGNQAPTLVTQPANATVTVGQAATFTVAANGYPVPTVQWQVSTNGGSTWTNDTTDGGATTTTLTVASTAAAQNGYEYRAVFTNSVGTATSIGRDADGPVRAGRDHAAGQRHGQRRCQRDVHVRGLG